MTLKVDTTGLLEALDYDAEVFVSLDDEKESFKVHLTVAVPASPRVDVSRPSGDWLFSWLAPGWQVSLTVLASAGGIQLIFQQNPLLTLLGLALLATALYSFVETGWMEHISSASPTVKSTATVSIASGLLTAAVAASFGMTWMLGLLLGIVVLYLRVTAVRT